MKQMERHLYVVATNSEGSFEEMECALTDKATALVTQMLQQHYMQQVPQVPDNPHNHTNLAHTHFGSQPEEV